MGDDTGLQELRQMDKAIAERKAAPAPVVEQKPPEETLAQIGSAAAEMTSQQRGAAFVRDVLDRAGIDAGHDTLFAGPIYQHLNSLNGQPADVDVIVNAVKLQATQMKGLKRVVPKADRERNLAAERMSDRAWLNHCAAQVRRGR